MGKKIQCIGRYAMDGVTLGKGNFAHVELATHGVTEVKVAIKIIDTRKIRDEYVRQNLHREARIMASLRHPNIIRLYETLKATTLYCLVTEFAAGGELLTYIKEQKDCRLGESASRSFIRQLVSAIHYLHERRIVHRDLKMENIMLDEKKKNIKLIDFGLSNICKDEEPLKTHCGSPEYAAPELFIVGKTYGPEVDIWSLGIIMYAIILGRLPFCTPFRDEYHRQRMLQQIQKGLSPIHDREMHTLTADCRNLLHQLIEPNPELRIPMAEILVHPWITKNDKCAFFAYVPPPRNKSLRNETVSELATLMDMKKGVVNETVKDHRADELSAMYNMMMDNKKKQHGLLDIDHTKKAWQERNARSRSGDRDKSMTPDNSKAKMSLVTRKFPATGGRKSGVGSKVKPKNRPVSISTAADGLTAPDRPPPSSSSDRTGRTLDIIDPATGLSSRVASPSSAQPPRDRTWNSSSSRRPGSSSLHHQTNPDRSGQTPAPGVTDPSRIPLSQRRVPPPKLSLTLDLSVTNPGVSSSSSAARQQRDDRASNPSSTMSSGERKDGAGAAAAVGSAASAGGATASLSSAVAAAIDCSFGIAASSGVPPRLSPKDPGNKDASSRIPVPSSSSSSSAVTAGPSFSSSGVRSPPPKVTSILSLPKARRPSSLQYCQRSSRLSIPRQSVCYPTAATNMSSARPQQPDGSYGGARDVLLAPRAVPEDSVIDSCSTDDSENRFLGTLVEALESSADTMQVDLLNVFDDSSLRNIELCRDEVQELLLVRAAASASSSFGGGPAGLPVYAAAVSSTRVEMHQPPSIHSLLLSSSVVQATTAASNPEPVLAPPPPGSRQASNAVRPLQQEKTRPHFGGLAGGGERSGIVRVDTGDKTLMRKTMMMAAGDSCCYAVEPFFHNEFKSSSTAAVASTTAQPTTTDSRSLLVGGRLAELSGVSSAPRLAASQPSETDTLVATASDHSSLGSKITHRSLTLSISGGSSGKLTAPKAVRGSGLSPGSPSYDEKHARFSHMGSHALDVFFSPEDESSPPGMLWRPVATKVQSSPVSGSSACRRPFTDGDPSRLAIISPLARHVAAAVSSGHASAAAPLAPLITSLDIFSDDDDDEDDDDDDNDDTDDDDEDGEPRDGGRGGGGGGVTQGTARPHRRTFSVPSNHRRRPVPLPVMSASASACTSSSSTGTGQVPPPPPVSARLEPPPKGDSVGLRRNGSSVEEVLGAAGASRESVLLPGGGVGGSAWLRLRETSLFQGDSRTSVVSDSNVWTSSTQMTQSCPVAAHQRLLSSESSTISQDSLEWSSKVNGSPERLANRSKKPVTVLKTDAKEPVAKPLSTSLTDDSSTTATTTTKNNPATTTATTTTMMTRSMFESKIPRPSSVRRRLPVLGNLLNRERRRSNASATSQKQLSDAQPPNKREDKRSQKGGDSSSSKPPSRVSSWRQGLTHWLQMSRASSSTNSNNNVVRPGTQKRFAQPPPNHTPHPASSGGGGPDQACPSAVSGLAASSYAQANSAPMSISLVSNHGCKSSLTIPNNYSKIHGRRILDITRDVAKLSGSEAPLPPGAMTMTTSMTTACVPNSGQTLVLSSSSPSKKSLQGHHVHSLLDVVDSLASVQSRSPLARLRVRKVQWQECQKCAHSDHSSDESASDNTGPAVADNPALIGLTRGPSRDGDTLVSSAVSIALNNISPNWT